MTLCSEACASFLMQKILLIEYHRNLSTGFIIEPFLSNKSNVIRRRATQISVAFSFIFQYLNIAKCVKHIIENILNF